MSNCQIVSLHNRDWGKKLNNWVTGLIADETGSPFIHTQIVLEGTMYECTYPQGYKKTENYRFSPNHGNIIQNTVRDLTERELGALIAHFEDKINKKIKYALLKLFVFLILKKTKPFWNKIGWTPMTLDEVYGEFCSAAIDIGLKFAGIDMLPDYLEEFTAPVEVISSWFLERP